MKPVILLVGRLPGEPEQLVRGAGQRLGRRHRDGQRGQRLGDRGLRWQRNLRFKNPDQRGRRRHLHLEDR